ncbi:MAG: lipopolysaccharide biosynthesis protein [Candidatus Wallbacteria bacterium]|nr:lipopolysaccharide biosynthesis protein [Candidatus Wallbacteria bacterium]
MKISLEESSMKPTEPAETAGLLRAADEAPPGKPTRTFLNKTVWYTVSYGLRALVSIVTVSVTTRYLKVHTYGVYSQVVAVGALLQQLVQFGMPRQLGIWLLEHPQGPDRAAAFWTALYCQWAVGAVLLSLVVPVVLTQYAWLDPVVAKTLLLFVTIGEVARALIISIQVQFDWDEDVRARLCQDILTLLVPAVLSCGLLAFAGAGIVGYTAGSNFGTALTAVALLAYVTRRYPPAWSLLRFQFALRSGGIFFLSHVCGAIIGSADRLLLAARGTGAVASGLYQMALGTASVMGGISGAIAQMVTRHVFQETLTDISSLARPVTLSLLFAPLFGLLASATTPVILRVLTPPSYHAAYAMVPPLVAAMGLAVCFNLGIAYVLQRKRFWGCLAYELSAAAANVVSNWLLIPLLDAWGCAASLLITYVWVSGVIWYREGLMDLPGAWWVAVRVAGLWAACAAVVVCLTRNFPPAHCMAALCWGGTAFLVLAAIALRESGSLPALRESAAMLRQRMREALG